MILELINKMMIPLTLLLYIVAFSTLIYIIYNFFQEDLIKLKILIYRFRGVIFMYVGLNIIIYFLLLAVTQLVPVDWLPHLSYPISLLLIYQLVLR